LRDMNWSFSTLVEIQKNSWHLYVLSFLPDVNFSGSYGTTKNFKLSNTDSEVL
jgi:hypothetical protein